MEQHSIPQQISSYEFKLVGEMTLKQFLKAAVGIVLALMINATGLVFFIKYPLVLALGGGGLALAFVPFEDRPLETWILSFLKSIYTPTILIYKKRADKNWLNIDYTRAKFIEEEKEEEEKAIPMKNKSKVAEFIDSLPSVKRADEEGENLESGIKNLDLKTKNQEMGEQKLVTSNKIQEGAEQKTTDWRGAAANLGLKSEKLEATAKATFGSIPMPDIPDLPNLLVGMVTSKEGKIVDGAIVEILDNLGNPVRVLKTNPLGQFRTSTQLSDGKYLVVTEKEGFGFDRVEINLSGGIVEPIKIQALA
ncbi:MAG: carboxypeptidase-like regulatory domain-containing protein [Candidatus Shapirobacteria bacterium]|jgi:hypothetical protein